MSRLFRFPLAAGLLAAFALTFVALSLNAQQPTLQKRIIPIQPRPTVPLCSGQPVVLLDTSNTAAVQNGPSGGPPAFTLRSPACITEVWDYHYSNGQGSAPGTITLELQRTSTSAAQNFSFRAGGNNVNWTAQPNPPTLIPPGDYLVGDSNPATWSRNQQSAYRFFTKVIGICAAPATGNGCIGSVITPVGSNPGTKPGGPVSTPTGPVSTPQPTVKPCHYTTNAMVEEVTPGCSGYVGTMIKLVVVRALPVMPSGIVFKQGPIGMGSGMPAPANLVLVEVKTAGTTRTGNGMAVGSTFSFPAPAVLCTNATTKPIGSAGRIAWDVWVAGPTGAIISGDVDDFVVDCP